MNVSPLPGYPDILIGSQNMYMCVCYDNPCFCCILYRELCFTILQAQTDYVACV